MSNTCRFAPSITGFAHPGTLLAALLCWLDARSTQSKFILRLEDLDHTRLRSGCLEAMVHALQWLGLDWDEIQTQSELKEGHEQALDQLAKDGILYPCSCSRKAWTARGCPSPDGGIAYDNQCRSRSLPLAGWRNTKEPLRIRLPNDRLILKDENGQDLSQCPSIDMGDPVVLRRDGVIAYHLAVVVDDSLSGVTRVVRGRDLAGSSATQVMVQKLLALKTPEYRHHFLLLEHQNKKLAKYRSSIPFTTFQQKLKGEQMCGLLAQIAGLQESSTPCTPYSLLENFHWNHVRQEDVLFPEDWLVKSTMTSKTF